MTSMIPIKTGMAVKRPVRIRSILTLRACSGDSTALMTVSATTDSMKV